MKRCEFFAGVAAAAAFPAVFETAGAAPTVAQPTPSEALAQLLAGNKRFAAGAPLHHLELEARRIETASGQQPFALVLACADSRVAPEFVFDQSIGALFVVRIAGNYAASGGIGSFEYAVEHFHSPVLLVLGHAGCGAVAATVDAVKNNQTVPGDLGEVVNAIRPSVVAAQAGSGDLLENAIQANVRRTLQELKAKSSVLADAVSSGKLSLVGAEYLPSTGSVSVLS